MMRRFGHSHNQQERIAPDGIGSGIVSVEDSQTKDFRSWNRYSNAKRIPSQPYSSEP